MQWYMPTRHISMSDVLQIRHELEASGGQVAIFRTTVQTPESEGPIIDDLPNCSDADRSAIGLTLRFPAAVAFPVLQLQIGSSVIPEIRTHVINLQPFEDFQRGQYSDETRTVFRLRDVIWRLIVTDNRPPIFTLPMVIDILCGLVWVVAAGLFTWQLATVRLAAPTVLIALVALGTAAFLGNRALLRGYRRRRVFYSSGRVSVRYPTRDVWRAERAKKQQLFLTGLVSLAVGVIGGIVLGVLGFK